MPHVAPLHAATQARRTLPADRAYRGMPAAGPTSWPDRRRHRGHHHAARQATGPGTAPPGPVHRRGERGPPGRAVLRRADPGRRVRGGRRSWSASTSPGRSLLEFVAEEGPLEGADLEALAIGIATGLAAVHQAGLVHGDFGPSTSCSARTARG